MIITEIKQIDSLVEQVLVNGANVISLDMNDYRGVKKSSTSLKAITLEISEWSAIQSLEEVMKETGCGSVTNVLICVGVSDAKAVSVAQMRMLRDLIHANTADANVVWGLKESKSEGSAIKILVVLGYSD